MAATDELILDTWSALDFKSRAVRDATRGLMPDWVGDQRRRLNAYMVLGAYTRNVSRYFTYLEPEDEDTRNDRAEFGEPGVIVDTVVSALLGNDVTIVGDHVELTAWANRWGRRAKVVRKLFNAEDHAVGLGDAVFVLSVDSVRRRVDIRTYEPGFYFPVLDELGDEEFPSRIHIAYEFLRVNAQGLEQTWIRRRTWELVDGTCRYWDGEILADDLELGSDYDTLPLGRMRWYVNSEGLELRDVDLGFDFIPVVHLPNTSPDDGEHFGESSVAKVLQIIDEIQATDTDLSKGASIAGFPPLASDGTMTATVESDGKRVETYGPGTVFNGSLSTIDTSKSLDALLKYLAQLLQRLAVNSHLPEAVIGRVKPSEVPSGLAFALGFAPLKSMVYRMRLIRIEKYPLIFKFAYRMSQAAGFDVPALPADGEDDDTIWPTFQPGPFLPSDVEATVGVITKLLQLKPRPIGIETAVRMLVEAGLPIDDVADEVDAIVAQDFPGAVELATATTDPREAFRYLGLDVPDDLHPFEEPRDEAEEITKVSRGPEPDPTGDPVVS